MHLTVHTLTQRVHCPSVGYTETAAAGRHVSQALWTQKLTSPLLRTQSCQRFSVVIQSIALHVSPTASNSPSRISTMADV